MKIYLSFFIIITLSFCIMLSGCGKNSINDQSDSAEEYEITLTALVSTSAFQSDCLASESIITDNSFETWYVTTYGEISVEPPKSEMTITFDGEEYYGRYKRTVINSLGMNVFYTYMHEDVYFSIDAKSGEIASVVIAYDYNPTTVSDKAFEIGEKEAKRIAEQYIDTSYFVLEKGLGSDKTDMYFRFVQYVGELKTDNYVDIRFDAKGRLTSFGRNVSSGYKLVEQNNNVDKMVTLQNSEKAQQIALNKVKNILAHQTVNKYELKSETIYILPDGKLVKAYGYYAELENYIKDENGESLYAPKTAIIYVAVFAQ